MVDKLVTQFWNDFQEYATSHIQIENQWKYLNRTYLDFSSGFKKWHFSLSISMRRRKMSCAVYISDDENLFQKFLMNRMEIEGNFRGIINWHDVPTMKAKKLSVTKSMDILNHDSWSEAFEWLEQQMHSFIRALERFSEFH